MRARTWVLVLLVIPFIAVLWPPFYAGAKPTLIGLPFFVWYQLAWAVISALLTAVVYVVREPGERAAAEERTEERRDARR